MVVYAKLLAKNCDTFGYITYVFECLDEEIRKETKYIMCTRFPNWEQKKIEIGDRGYLNFFEIRAGIDKWYDGKNFINYKYNNIQFIKFIKENKIKDTNYIM